MTTTEERVPQVGDWLNGELLVADEDRNSGKPYFRSVHPAFESWVAAHGGLPPLPYRTCQYSELIWSFLVDDYAEHFLYWLPMADLAAFFGKRTMLEAKLCRLKAENEKCRAELQAYESLATALMEEAGKNQAEKMKPAERDVRATPVAK